MLDKVHMLCCVCEREGHAMVARNQKVKRYGIHFGFLQKYCYDDVISHCSHAQAELN